MKTDLEYRVTVPNDDSEQLEIECEETSIYSERYTLRAEKGRWVVLNAAEIDELMQVVKTFRAMKKELPNG